MNYLMTNLPKRIVEGNCVNYIPMTFQGEKFFSWQCVPHFACSVITSSDKTELQRITISVKIILNTNAKVY